ncbi:aminoglycoside phosphotransferase family protein [Natronomonas sp. F2-12]|jgi:5-methylthioribose kinase|uniref:Aminoglycoside phosphotransferase family protein n=1 Tax=Natronomonas aquatica TaxID=2841590 RepID=A0A9R1CQK4_9EURY|nr:aminoglycoside phosphotransferase family protein [Natronomonas aquatica]MCQ4332085.1 aminoglycoside phosphotransferase family protein [Natronomonas aquatica]
MSFTLSPDTAAAYLAGRGEIADPSAVVEAAELGGGVSNRVVMVRTGEDCLVLKQPRPNLDVEADWPADVDRVHNEAAATRTYEALLAPTELPATVPGVRFEDDEDDVVGFECAPDDARMWKADLLGGSVDVRVAEAVGDVLGTVHEGAADEPERLAPFESKLPFDQLRIDPYHRTVARRHPDVAGAVEAATERLLDSKRTLVHGDYSPKNVLVEDDDTFRVWILDFEVAHRGDPTFDTAFMLNHLFIKSVYNADRGAEYREAARAFFDAYDGRVTWDIEAETVEELGVLMLARVDGKSPVEYVERTETKETLRRIAKRTLTDPIRDLDAFERLVRTETA